jgi:hypothetical protein
MTETVRTEGGVTRTDYSATDYNYLALVGTSAGVAKDAYMGGVLVSSQTTNTNSVSYPPPRSSSVARFRQTRATVLTGV